MALVLIACRWLNPSEEPTKSSHRCNERRTCQERTTCGPRQSPPGRARPNARSLLSEAAQTLCLVVCGHENEEGEAQTLTSFDAAAVAAETVLYRATRPQEYVPGAVKRSGCCFVMTRCRMARIINRFGSSATAACFRGRHKRRLAQNAALFQNASLDLHFENAGILSRQITLHADNARSVCASIRILSYY